VILGATLLLVLIFFVTPFSVSSGSMSSWLMKLIIITLLASASYLLFNAVKPVIDTRGILETDLFPELKTNFFITVGFILIIAAFAFVVVRL